MIACSQCSAEIKPRRSADGDAVAECENCGAVNLSWATSPAPDIRRVRGGSVRSSSPLQDLPEVSVTSGSLVGLLF